MSTVKINELNYLADETYIEDVYQTADIIKLYEANHPDLYDDEKMYGTYKTEIKKIEQNEYEINIKDIFYTPLFDHDDSDDFVDDEEIIEFNSIKGCCLWNSKDNTIKILKDNAHLLDKFKFKPHIIN